MASEVNQQCDASAENTKVNDAGVAKASREAFSPDNNVYIASLGSKPTDLGFAPVSIMDGNKTCAT